MLSSPCSRPIEQRLLTIILEATDHSVAVEKGR